MNQRIGEKNWLRLNPDERRKIIISRGWTPGRYPSNKRKKNINKRKKGVNKSGIVGFLRNYISYPYKNKTKTFGKGKIITAITKIVVGNFGTQTVVQLSEILYSAEYQSLEKNFLYYKTLGVGLTFMPQNKDITENLYFMINWNGEPLANFRINDNVNVVPPYIIKPKTFYFKIPRLNDFSGIMSYFRSTQDMSFMPTLQLSCPENTIDWAIRVDIVVEFRSLNVRTPTNKYLFVDKKEESEFDEKIKNEDKIFRKIYDEAIAIKKKKIEKSKNYNDEYFINRIIKDIEEEKSESEESFINENFDENDNEENKENEGEKKIIKSPKKDVENNLNEDDSLNHIEKKIEELKKIKREIAKQSK